MNEIESELRAYIFAESNKVNKIACATIRTTMSRIKMHLEKEVRIRKDSKSTKMRGSSER